MVPLSAVVCFALLSLATATDVLQCSGQSIEGLSERVQLSPCKRPPCKLKKGTDQHISIAFTPLSDLATIDNKVTADVFGLELPFIGVDGNSICDKLYTESGDKTSCPVKAGTKYVYKDSFPILTVYPSIDVKVHWALQHKKKDIICFEVPAKIK